MTLIPHIGVTAAEREQLVTCPDCGHPWSTHYPDGCHMAAVFHHGVTTCDCGRDDEQQERLEALLAAKGAS